MSVRSGWQLCVPSTSGNQATSVIRGLESNPTVDFRYGFRLHDWGWLFELDGFWPNELSLKVFPEPSQLVYHSLLPLLHTRVISFQFPVRYTPRGSLSQAKGNMRWEDEHAASTGIGLHNGAVTLWKRLFFLTTLRAGSERHNADGIIEVGEWSIKHAQKGLERKTFGVI